MNLYRYLRKILRRDSGSAAMTLREGGVPMWDAPLRSAMSVSTVFRCVELLSNSVANLPLQTMRRERSLFVPDDSFNLPYLLNVQPDAAMNAVDFWRQVVIDVLLGGNAYIVPQWDSRTGGWMRLALCRRGTVTHDTVADTYTISDPYTGVEGTFGESEVIHIKGMPASEPKNGVSVLTYARMATEIARVGDSETASRFRNGGDVRGIIGNDRSLRGFGEYQTAELSKTASMLDWRFNKAGDKIVAMPGQVDWHQLSMTSADMQFLESRKFTVREICRFFGVHPSFVFDDTSNNYKSAEMANVAFLSNTLNPLLRRIETELLRKLYGERSAMSRRVTFDRRELYACDLDSKMRYMKGLIETGICTVNEARAMENRPPVDGGDRVLVSANLKGITELTGQPEGTPVKGNQ